MCFIVLGAKSLSQSQMDAIEEKCNECIRDRLPMTPRWLQPGSKELEEASYGILWHIFIYSCYTK